MFCTTYDELIDVNTKSSDFDSSPTTPDPQKILTKIRINSGVWQTFKGFSERIDIWMFNESMN